MVKQWDSIWCYFSITSNAVIDDPIETVHFPNSKLEFEAGQVTISRTRNLQYAILKPLKIQQQEGITRIRIFKSRVLNGNDCSWKRIRVAGQGALVMSAADGPKTLLSHSSWWWFSEGISKSSYFHLCSCRQTVAEIPPKIAGNIEWTWWWVTTAQWGKLSIFKTWRILLPSLGFQPGGWNLSFTSSLLLYEVNDRSWVRIPPLEIKNSCPKIFAPGRIRTRDLSFTTYNSNREVLGSNPS